MFTMLAGFLAFCLLPFVLGPAIPFHMIKEEKRYINRKSLIPPEEWYLLCCVAIVYVFEGITTLYFPNLPYLLKTMITTIGIMALFALALSYIYKIVISLVKKAAVIIFGGIINSTTLKVGILILNIIILLAALENMHVIPTYLR